MAEGIANQAEVRRKDSAARAEEKTKEGRGALQENNEMAIRKPAQDN